MTLGRQRLRVGRGVLYHPTDDEITARGAGPWLALIVNANSDGTADLLVNPPQAPSLTEADAAPTTVADGAGGSYGAGEEELLNDLKAKINEAVPLINELRDAVTASRKASVREGTTAGTFSFAAGSDSI